MTTNHPPQLIDFIGRWTVDRIIRDQSGRPDATFKGVATFTPDGAALVYHEEGELTLANQTSFKAERRYLWRETNSGIAIDFQDGRPFHSFDPHVPQAEHWCDPDTYVVSYRFADWPRWTSVWTVSGPRKAYEMITRYAPLNT